jgi:hypothetical protein
MGFLDRLFGREQDEQRPDDGARAHSAQPGANEDEQALARYRYLLRTAPPDALEEVHAEAFARLTPEQRRLALQELAGALPAEEGRHAAAAGDDPRALARFATRAELRRPGVMERLFGGGGFGGSAYRMGGGPGLASSFLAGAVGSLVAQQLFSSFGGFHGGDAADGAYANANDTNGADAEGDIADVGDADFGGDFDI